MIIIIMGVAGSGKSTIGLLLARELGWDFYDGDDFHSTSNRAKMSKGFPLTDEDRAGWLLVLKNLIIQNNQHGKSIVLACSALKNTYRHILHIDNNVKFVYLRGNYELIEARLKTRKGHFMSKNMLSSQFKILEEPEQALVIDITNSPEEIVHNIREGLNL